MKGINIELTEWQTEMVGPLFKEVREAFDRGDPGSIIAQVFESRGGGGAFMQVQVLSADEVKKMYMAIGMEEGRTPTGEAVYVDVIVPD